MTLDDEKVMWMLRECAKKAGYQTRMAAEGFVGVTAPAKVCKLLELIHAEVVDELVRTSGHIARLHAESKHNVELQVSNHALRKHIEDLERGIGIDEGREDLKDDE